MKNENIEQLKTVATKVFNYTRNVTKGLMLAVLVMLFITILEHLLIHYNILKVLPDFFNGWMACTAFLIGAGKLKN